MNTARSLSSRSVLGRSIARPLSLSRSQCVGGQRWVQISTQPAGTTPDLDQLTGDVTADLSASNSVDAGFEVLGAPFSLLRVSLSASQPFFTRRGTLVGLNGKADSVVSSLSFLEPVTRAVLGIPFFYQKITSTSPVTALISSKSNYTSFATVHLDGTLDWMIAQRNALLCWTGQTISLSARMNTSLSLAHWGSTQVTGRGLLGVVGKGQIYEVDVAAGEQYIVHPSNVVAYSMNRSAPTPYRFKSSMLRLQVPGLNWFQQTVSGIKFFRTMQQTHTWRFVARALYILRTWSRRTIWGDRLFLQFEGPTTILLQTRGSRMTDVLTAKDVNEIADSEPGVVTPTGSLAGPRRDAEISPPSIKVAEPTKMSYASVGSDGNVKFDINKQ